VSSSPASSAVPRSAYCARGYKGRPLHLCWTPEPPGRSTQGWKVSPVFKESLLKDIGYRYADGEIVREGYVGDQGDGAFSTGVSIYISTLSHRATADMTPKRGGAANIGSPGLKHSMQPHDEEAIPEIALRHDQPGNHHVGVRS